ncbi:hypothetical protein HOLleu_10750 [Holothuria leucospilota]|uniref:Uncharacterized protein n=1 Tax=Holothuria leucospilota TaxID=206669 RepID=A0A9Q1CF50_HOLLE|nr:hypothetical protein HOLleu_10750 [Holothuria leucospilota]
MNGCLVHFALDPFFLNTLKVLLSKYNYVKLSTLYKRICISNLHNFIKRSIRPT